MKLCIINPDLPATCNDCYLLANGCDGIEEMAICDICGAVIISANELLIHIKINHK
jgi:hypothetical protein